MIPQKAPHPYPAEVLMNYYYDPQVAAKVTEYVNYISPVEGVAEFAPKLADNPLIFPPAEIREKLHPYPSLSPADERKMQEAMAQVTGA
jgi:spermidine/putrescine transport system substrate-binding protein